MKRFFLAFLLLLNFSLALKATENPKPISFSEDSIVASIKESFGEKLPATCFIGLFILETDTILLQALDEGSNIKEMPFENFLLNYSAKMRISKGKVFIEDLNVAVKDEFKAQRFSASMGINEPLSIKTKWSFVQKGDDGETSKKLNVLLFIYNNLNPKLDIDDSYAQLAFSIANETGDLSQAFEYYKKAFANGNAEARKALALYYANGICVEKNIDTALELIVDYSKLNISNEERLLLFYIVKNNLAKPKNRFFETLLSEDLASFSKRNLKVKTLQYFPSQAFDKVGAKITLKTASDWLIESADSGDAQSQVFLSRAYKYAWLLEKSEEKSEKYRNQALAQNHPIAIFDSGLCLIENSKEEGLALIKESFKKGYIFAYTYSFADVISSKEDILLLESYVEKFPYLSPVVAEAYLKGFYVEESKEKVKSLTSKLAEFRGEILKIEKVQHDFYQELKSIFKLENKRDFIFNSKL